jgi:hypothetical protein
MLSNLRNNIFAKRELFGLKKAQGKANYKAFHI